MLTLPRPSCEGLTISASPRCNLQNIIVPVLLQVTYCLTVLLPLGAQPCIDTYDKILTHNLQRFSSIPNMRFHAWVSLQLMQNSRKRKNFMNISLADPPSTPGAGTLPMVRRLSTSVLRRIR